MMENYIKLAADLKMKADVMTMGELRQPDTSVLYYYPMKCALPAMAKALIEAEEALRELLEDYQIHEDHPYCDIGIDPSVEGKAENALSQIQALNGGGE